MRTTAAVTFSKDPATLGTSGLVREKFDAYFTPAWCTEALLDALPCPLPATVWEPACGDGAIVRPLQAAGCKVVASDLIDHGAGYRAGIDFLTVERLPTVAGRPVSAVVTNPPYNRSDAFTRRALALLEAAGGGLLALFMRLEYACGQRRRDLFTRPDFAGNLIVGRPRWYADTTVSPRFEYAWLLWRVGERCVPEMRFASRRAKT